MRGGSDGARRGAAAAQQSELENTRCDKTIHIHQAHGVVGVAVHNKVRPQQFGESSFYDVQKIAVAPTLNRMELDHHDAELGENAGRAG